MDQRTSLFTEDLMRVGRRDVSITNKLVPLERRILKAADKLTTTYSRILKGTRDGVDRLGHQTTTALSPIHPTTTHPWTMPIVALCAGYAIGRVQGHPCRSPFTVSTAPPLGRRRL